MAHNDARLFQIKSAVRARLHKRLPESVGGSPIIPHEQLEGMIRANKE